jgi:hypothetical protein
MLYLFYLCAYLTYKPLGKFLHKINIDLYPIQYLNRGKRMGEITYLTKAASKSASLRTTVPMSLVKQFGLTEDDKLDWILKAEGGELVIIIKPIKNR